MERGERGKETVVKPAVIEFKNYQTTLYPGVLIFRQDHKKNFA